MTAITYRLEKGSALTFLEGDNNFRTLANAASNSVKNYGAVGDGVTDDTAAIQAAIDALKGATETNQLVETRILFFPKGIYMVSAPINLYSGIIISGEGQGSLIKATAGFAGTALVLLKGQGANAFWQFSGYRDMGFECTGATWCVKASAGVVGNSEFRNGYIDAGFGLDLGTYAQECVVDGLFSAGPLDQLLHLKGNHNIIRNLDKEGNTGSSADPYILAEDHALGNSTGNLFDFILLEGTTSVNKTPMKLLNCSSTHLDHLWLEPTLTDGYGLRLQGCTHTRIGQISSGLVASTTMKVDTSVDLQIDVLEYDGEDVPLSTVLEVDTTSDVHVVLMRSRRGQDQFPLAKMGRNLFVDDSYIRLIQSDAPTGYSPLSRARWLAGQNLAQNGSFEAGRYLWTFSAIPNTTEEYITSEVGQGLMGHFVWSTVGSRNLTQDITVPANMPVTVTAKVKFAAGTGWAYIYTNGVGITNANYGRAQATEWQIITRTVIPTSAGTLTVGFDFVNVSEVYVDEFSVSVGNLGVPNQGKFGTIEVGGKTINFAAAAPTTGTWKQGDVTFNTAVAAAGVPGWSCTTGGSPGTWKAWAAVAA